MLDRVRCDRADRCRIILFLEGERLAQAERGKVVVRLTLFS